MNIIKRLRSYENNRKLIAEYKIRFRDTEKIKEEGYPWGTLAININGDGIIPLISGDNIWTKNRKRFKIRKYGYGKND